MTDASLHLTRDEHNRALNRFLSAAAVWFGAFLGGFVIAEPAPYELYMAGLIGIWALTGPVIPRSAFVPLLLLTVFNIGGVIAMTQMDSWSGTPMYLAVSAFLAATTVFYAAVVGSDPRFLPLIFNGYLAAAVVTGLAGILGYFGFAGETFVRYGRAKGMFEDPNVFAPFLMLPTVYCLYAVLTRPLRHAMPAFAALLVLVLAIFLSFSRAGWGMLVLSSALLAGILLLGNASGRFRLRIILLAIFSVAAAAMLLAIALQFEAVRNLFFERAQLVQDYDGARLGRFARHWIGYKQATETPLGLGAMQFGKIYGEDPHNVWLKALFAYSWLGYAAYATLIVVTLGAGLKILFRERPWQPFLLSAYIVFFCHVLIGNIIDTDHWRHFYLLLGILWGCIALEARWHSGEIKKEEMVGAAGFEPTTP